MDSLTSNVLDRNTSDEQHDCEHELTSTGSKVGLRIRPRSVGDISESLHGVNHHINFPDLVIESSGSNNSISNYNNNSGSGRASSGVGNNQSSSTSNSGSGFLSFLGIHFNKSNTRHLERSTGSGQNHSSSGQSDKPSKTLSENRYTKFPVSGSCNPAASGICVLQNCLTHPTVVSTFPVQESIPFDSTHIHLTPLQTRNFSCSSRSPVLPSREHSSSTGHTNNSTVNFLTNAVSSLGRRAKDGKGKQHLKVKSKSDNNLHRVTLNSKNSSIVHSKPAFYPSADIAGVEPRLNSVQLGDHATIRLPWTGFQQNNLSSVTTNKSHPNTHTNFEFNSRQERYVDCDLLHQTHQHLPEHIFLGNNSSNPHSSCTPRRRSRSLERTSNFRIFPSTLPPLIRPTNNCGTQSHRSNSSVGTNSLERQYRSRLRQTLNRKEQETLLRNICRGDPLPSEAHFVNLNQNKTQPRHTTQGVDCSTTKANFKLALPEKPQNLKPVESDFSFTSKKENSHNCIKKPPLLGRLHRSAPNSSFSSTDSSCDSTAGSISSPPSPPPRPASTLKPNKSRLVNQPLNKGPPLFPKNSSKVTSTKFPFPSNKTMNSSQQRRPVPPPLTTFTGVSQFGASPIVQSLSDVESVTSGSETVSRRLGGGMSSLEDARNSGFINKPTKGWLHSDQLLTKEGVSYTVRVRKFLFLYWLL